MTALQVREGLDGKNYTHRCCVSHKPLADVLGSLASQAWALSPPGALIPGLPSYLKPSADIQS